MNILITGANGQLGNEMRVLSKENGQHAYFFTDVQELDICDEQAVHRFVFAMAFCPTSGVFYFGILIPMSATTVAGYLLPVLLP